MIITNNKIPQSECEKHHKEKYQEYLEKERCKVEEKVEFKPCDYDPCLVYFLQYRPTKVKDSNKIRVQ